MTGLEGVRVLELGEMVSAAYATKLMGDLGADVIKVEPPEGERARHRGPFPGGAPDPERSGLFLYLNTNKRGVTLDLPDRAARERLATLIASSDILVHNLTPEHLEELELRPAELLALQPQLVTCSITPFGLRGPHSRYRAEEITVAHAGGWAYLSPGASEYPEEPPLKAFGHLADFQGGLVGATAALAAYYRAQRTGGGEHIDLSAQEYVASFLEAGFIGYTYLETVGTRLGQRGLNPWKIFRCKDGLIFLCVIEADQWDRLVRLMGNPEWTELEVFADFPGRLENVDLLNQFVQEWIANWTVQELYHEGQKHRICFAPVFSMAELARQEHLGERGFFVNVKHPLAGDLVHLGAPYRLRQPWWEIRRPAPRLGEHNGEVFAEREAPRARKARGGASGLPLEGVRVLDLTWVWAGPFCAMQLAHLGAEVIKLESEGRPDLGRRLPILPPDLESATLNSSGYFNQWNQGKKSVCLNLAEPRGVEILKQLVAHADVVVDNFATGVMGRLGLDDAALRAIKPDLIVASISGYGHTGPYREYMAYGPALAPLSGLSSLSGYPASGPQELGISLGDPTAGITAAVAICAALAARERTGEGQSIDVSLWEATAALVAEGWMEFAMNGTQPERMGNRDPLMAPHNCYRCEGEDTWVTIACASDEEWRRLCEIVAPERTGDPRFATARDRKAHEDELDRMISHWTAERDRFEITRELQAVGVAAFPSLTVEDLANDPHLEARGFLERLEHPEVGARAHTGIPWRLARGPSGVRSPAPLLGAHTAEVLRELLGLSPAEIQHLRDAKILY